MFDPIIVNGEMLEVVDSAKILGLTVSNNLKWNNYIDQIISKARKRLYFLSQLKRARVGTKELVLFFTTCIRPILEYASPVFHNGLTNYLSQDWSRSKREHCELSYLGSHMKTLYNQLASDDSAIEETVFQTNYLKK